MRKVEKYLPVFIFALALAARLLPGARTIDDSFITFRYARNVLAGEGLVYNAGERVLGTTTPMYAAVMVLLGTVTGGVNAPFPALAMGFNALADAVTCLLLFNLGKRLGSVRAGAGAALVWAILPYSVTFAIGGLETSLYVLLLTATVYAHITARHTLAALLGALGVLTRPDALILLGPVAVDRLLAVKLGRARAQPVRGREVLAGALPLLGWVLFAMPFYGSPLPHSISAKAVAYLLPPGGALVRLLQHFATPFMGHLTFGTTWWIGLGLILYPTLFLIGARQVWQRQPRLWPWLAYPWLYFATFAIADPLIFRWYLTPPLPAYIFGILLGLDHLMQAFGKRARHAWWTTAVPALLVVALPVALCLQDWQWQPDHGPNRPAPSIAWYKLELLYRQAADSLAADIARSSQPLTLAAGDVGVLGFFTSARILDTVGLNSPEAVAYYPTNPDFHVNAYAVAPDLIIDHQPDFVVLLEVYGREGLFKDPRFVEGYRLRLKIPTDIYDSDGMLIFERVR